MAHKNFKKEDFTPTNDGRYQLEYRNSEIGSGSNLTVEKKKENGEYETLQAEIDRFENSIFIRWSEPFDGRLIFEK